MDKQSNNVKLLDFFRSHGIIRGLPRGTVLFEQDALVGEVYLLERGYIKLTRLEQPGDEMIVEISAPGAIFGLTSTIDLTPSSVSAVTLTRCLIHSIPRRYFIDALEKAPQVAESLFTTISLTHRDLTVRCVEIGITRSRHRLAKLLLKWMAPGIRTEDGKIKINIPLQKGEIAKYLAIKPEQLSRVITAMENEGIIARENGWIIVGDIAKLELEARRI